VDGDFSSFIKKILEAEVQFSGSRLVYQSPSQGRLEFGWEGLLRHEGRTLSLENYPRYASPYCQADFPPEKIQINLGDDCLNLDWITPQRSNSGTID
jgi:hypothetical protein